MYLGYWVFRQIALLISDLVNFVERDHKAQVLVFFFLTQVDLQALWISLELRLLSVWILYVLPTIA